MITFDELRAMIPADWTVKHRAGDDVIPEGYLVYKVYADGSRCGRYFPADASPSETKDKAQRISQRRIK